MRHTSARSYALLNVILLSFLFAHTALAQTDERSRAVAPNAPEIAYNVSMPKPQTHMLEVEARLRYASAPPAVELRMPVWTPGSYLVREFERNVQDFAPTGDGGRTLQWAKTDKDTWRVETAGSRELRVRYSGYCNQLSVRTNEVNDRHAFWNN